jgi:hypothetical protein
VSGGETVLKSALRSRALAAKDVEGTRNNTPAHDEAHTVYLFAHTMMWFTSYAFREA